MTLEIRPVRPEEWDEAGAVTALAYEEFATAHGTWGEYLGRIADVRGRAAHALVLAALDDGRLLGTVTLELQGRVPGGHERPPLAPGEANVRMLGVHPEARRRGIGRALMEACVAEARRAGKTRLTLETTERMEAARRMYERMGFRRAADLVFDDGFRLLRYELPLPAPAGREGS